MKVALVRDRINPFLKHNTSHVTMALPFWKSNQGLLVHRVRSGHLHSHRYDASHHISLRMWCGMNGFPGKKGNLYSESPENAIHCATCEGKAIGAGLDGARQINGRMVLFQPRT